MLDGNTCTVVPTKNASTKQTVRRRCRIVAMLEKHGPLMNAGQPCWEESDIRIVAVSRLAMTRDFLDSRSDKLQTPYPIEPTQDNGSARSRLIGEDINEKG